MGCSSTVDDIWRWHGNKSYFGEDVLAEDFNQDGLTDIGVIVQSSDIGGTNKGALLIYEGQLGDPPFKENPTTITGKDRYDQLASVALCDVNGDGFSDLVLGSPYADDDSIEGEQGKNVGAINIHFGSSNGFNSEPDIQRFGKRLDTNVGWRPEYYLQLGEHLATGDFNQDGLCDIVAATAQAGPIGEARDTSDYRGMVAIFLGSDTSVSVTPDKIIGLNETDLTANFGEQITVGDVDDDGADELFISAWRHDYNGNTNNGAVFGFDHITFGNNSPFLDALDADWLLMGDHYDFFGSGLVLEDFTGNGALDVVVGAPYRSVNGTRDGGILIFDNQSLLTTTEPLTPDDAIEHFGITDQNWSRFAQKMAVIQDINGDSTPDFAALHAQYTDEANAVFDLEMLAVIDSAGNAFYGDYPGLGGGSYFGMDAALIDVDGDTLLDLCIGAPKAGANNRSRRRPSSMVQG